MVRFYGIRVVEIWMDLDEISSNYEKLISIARIFEGTRFD